MQRARIERREPVELRSDLPAQFERRPFQQHERAPDAAFGLRRRLADLFVIGVAAERARGCRCHLVDRQWTQHQPPAARADGRQQPRRRVAHQQQQRVLRRLLQYLQQRVGALRVLQLVGGVDNAHPPAALAGGRAEERHRLADVLDPDHGEELAGLLVDRRVRAPAGRDAPARRCVAQPDDCRRPRATWPP